LVDLLSDPEEKTRANAAGALGNLARNAADVVPELINAKAVEALLSCLESNSVQTQIVLFSLGTLCSHDQIRKTLDHKTVSQVINQFSSNPDTTIQKYLSRIRKILSDTAG
jgi:fused-like protein